MKESLNLPIQTLDDLVQKPSIIDSVRAKMTYNTSVVLTNGFIPLYKKLINNDICENGTIEIINCSFILDPLEPKFDFNGKRKTISDYTKKEFKWYMSQDLSIKAYVDDVTIWQECCTKDDKQEINSNYGWACFSEANYSQFLNCYRTLLKDKYSRQAMIFFNRPSMQIDHCRNGMHDFMCAIYSHFFIRDNRLIMIHRFRSNDIMLGFCSSDIAWIIFLYQNMYYLLKEKYSDLQIGHIIYEADSMHCYSRHFKLLREIVESYMKDGELR